jgi:hypothetical protein
MGRNYWMFTETDEEFEVTRDLGFTLHGVGKKYRRRAQRMQPDDRVILYVSGIRKWTATTTITSRSFEDYSIVWKPGQRGEKYPYRVKMSPDIVLDEEDYIDALILAPTLEYVKHWAPEDWPLAFFEKLHLLPQRDFRLIESEMKRTLSNKRKNAQQEERREPPSEQPEEPQPVAVREQAAAEPQVPPASPGAQVAEDDS